MEQTLEIVIDQLMTDEEFRHCFFRSPRGTLRLAEEWGLPLSESEVHSLMAATRSVWDRLAADVTARLQDAA